MPCRNQSDWLAVGSPQVETLGDIAAAANAYHSLLAVSPFSSPTTRAQNAGQWSTTLPYFSVGADNCPQLVIPTGWVDMPATTPATTPAVARIPRRPLPTPTRSRISATASPAASTTPIAIADPASSTLASADPLAIQTPTDLAPNPAPTPLPGLPSFPITVPAGASCPTGYSPASGYVIGADGTIGTLDDIIQRSIANMPVVTPSDLAVGGACIPAPTVTTEGKWITADDFLSVTVLAFAPVANLAVNARVLDCRGVVHYFSASLAGVTQGLANTFIVPLTPGYLIDVCVSDPGATVQLGTIQVSIALQHSSQAGLAPTAILAQGYVTGVWSLAWPAANTGAPATPQTPVGQPPLGVRGTGIQTSVGASFVVYWPAGTKAGDLAIIFGFHEVSITVPTGWTLQWQAAAGDWGSTFYKVLTAGDITAGSVTVSCGGAYNGIFAIITFVGGTNWNPGTAKGNQVVNQNITTASLTTSGSGQPQPGNVGIYFAAWMNTCLVSCDRGTKLQQLPGATGCGGCLYGETLVATGQVTANWTSSAIGYNTESMLIIQL